MTTIETTSAEPRSRARLDLWKLVAIVILVLAVATRLYALGDRAVSHDETTHAKYSWNLYTGQGFRHDPLMHGPLLFEATALIYAIFGVSDFTARVYTALTGIALVMAPLLFRKWLGRLGAILGSIMLLISPSITYYSRYTRHDIPMILSALLLLWAVLRYLDEGQDRWLRWMGLFFALMYATKENAYIYTAIFAILLALPFLWYVLKSQWSRPALVRMVLGLLALALVGGAVFGLGLRRAQIVEPGEGNNELRATLVPAWGRLGLLVAVGALVATLIVTVLGVGGTQMRAFRLFDILMVLGTLTLPLASALVMKYIFGVNMNTFYPAMMALNFGAVPTASLIGVGASLILMFALAIGLGLWWDRQRWPLIALAHYSVFFILFSTILTYGWGVLTGLVGGLAYWMAQQGVERGSQPWYYYGLVGPLYEYMPILISLIGGGGLAGSRLLHWARTVEVKADGERPEKPDVPFDLRTLLPDLFPFFLLAWALLSWIAYIFAGEKMPWLFVHIAFPHILLAAWSLNRLFRGLLWRTLFGKVGWMVPVSLAFLWMAWSAFRTSSGAIRQVLEQSGATEGLAATVAQLEPLGRVSGGLIGILFFSGLLLWALNREGPRRSMLLIAWTVIVALSVLTVRTSVMLNVINDEMANEYMVYAHGTPDVKEVLGQLEAISWRLTGTPDEIQVAYGKDVAWPFYWYMYAHFPNNYYFETPEAERLLASPVIIAARSEWEMVEEIVGEAYRAVDYKHIWWPVEDYKDLTWERVRAVFTEPERRRAIWDIVWARDYRRYARLRNPDDPFTFTTWPHRMEFRFYVREDLAEQVWDYQLEDGRAVSRIESGANLLAEAAADPYQQDERPMTATLRIVLPYADAEPRGIAVAPDGALYVADSALHRIWSVTPNGVVGDFWGDYGVEAGHFNTPWDLALGDGGSLYVADTWNHRIQRLDDAGDPLLAWGRLAQVDAGDPTGQGGFLGPRGVAAGADGRLYVADTGNHRVQIFDAEGRFLSEFGGVGMGLPDGEQGVLREPAGLALGPEGEVFIADAWARRIQVFDANGVYLRAWEVPVWGQGRPEDRPQLVWADGRLYATDPAYQRILVFDANGALLAVLKDAEMPLLAGGVAVYDGMLYATSLLDTAVVGYPLPEMP